MAGGKDRPGAKEKRLAAKKSVAKEKHLVVERRPKKVAKEKRRHKVGTVANLYMKAANGSSTLIGRKRGWEATKETSVRRGRPSGSTPAPRGKHPRASSPLPAASSSESEEEERPEVAEEESEEEEQPEDDYQDRHSEESEEDEQPEESEEDSDAVADQDLLRAHPLELIGTPRNGKVYLRGRSSQPARESHGLLDVGGDM